MVAESGQSSSILVRGGYVIDPSQRLSKITNILIVDSNIIWMGDGNPPQTCEYNIIPAEQMLVCPGFIDLHCHLREPGFEDKETIATGTSAAVKGGFTTVCCMPNTQPPIDKPYLVELVMDIAKKVDKARVLPIACISKGRKGNSLTDMPSLSSAGAVAFSDDGSPVMEDSLMQAALENSLHLKLAIMDHCEYLPLTKDGVINEGRVARELNLKGIPAEAEEIMISRNISLAKLTGGRIHISHVSTAHSVELVRIAKRNGINITAEVTPHHLTLTEETVLQHGTNAKVSPPLRTQTDIQALIEGINDGTIDAIATDHAPHTTADKRCDLPSAAFGISGFETALGVLLGLVHSSKIDINTLITKLTVGPIMIIGKCKGGSGTLRVGTAADITVIDPDREWLVDTDKFISKGKNSPWNGCTLKGKVMATLVDGRIVYSDPLIQVKKSLML